MNSILYVVVNTEQGQFGHLVNQGFDWNQIREILCTNGFYCVFSGTATELLNQAMIQLLEVATTLREAVEWAWLYGIEVKRDESSV